MAVQRAKAIAFKQPIEPLPPRHRGFIDPTCAAVYLNEFFSSSPRKSQFYGLKTMATVCERVFPSMTMTFPSMEK
jgi:hypothetical protein